MSDSEEKGITVSLSKESGFSVRPIDHRGKCNPVTIKFCEDDGLYPIVSCDLPIPDSIPEALREMYQRGEVGTVQTIEIDEESVAERSFNYAPGGDVATIEFNPEKP